MKLFVLFGLLCSLFAGTAGAVTPTSTCSHEHTSIIPDGSRFHHGYNHTYTTSEGTKSCAVTVYYIYNREECNACHFVLQTFKVDEYSVHSNPNHD